MVFKALRRPRQGRGQLALHVVDASFQAPHRPAGLASLSLQRRDVVHGNPARHEFESLRGLALDLFERQ